MNFIQIEKKVEKFQSELHASVLDFILAKFKHKFSQCPNCQSTNVVIYKANKVNKETSSVIKTSFGSDYHINPELLLKGRCNNCNSYYDITKDILEIIGNDKFSPLTQMKICSANRAGSYENAVKNLDELANLNINKNQVRNISNHVGNYISKEFDELYEKIQQGIPSTIIKQKHPLVETQKIDKKYLDKSKYFILLAVDGGRMQLFDWIPPKNDQLNGKKSLYWHENKVFRISIYSKTDLADSSTNEDKNICVSSQMISGLTTYGATNRSWQETAPIIAGHLYMRGIDLKNIDVCISDGSEHIMSKIFKPLFPTAAHILDYYHKSEALYKCLKVSGQTKNEDVDKLKNLLWEGDIDQLIFVLKETQLKVGKPDEGKRDSENPKVVLDNFINHLSKNKPRLQYGKFREFGYPIGSGSIESAVKLFGKRIKGTEKQWNEYGGEAILNLYAFLLSEDERWKTLWEVQTPWM